MLEAQPKILIGSPLNPIFCFLEEEPPAEVKKEEIDFNKIDIKDEILP